MENLENPEEFFLARQEFQAEQSGADTDDDAEYIRLARSGHYTGPKNYRRKPDTTYTDEIGVMNYPSSHPYKRYSGQWIDGLFEGNGHLILRNGNEYIGEWYQGDLSEGKIIYNNGDVFEGSILSDTKRKGKFTYHDGDIYSGDFALVRVNEYDAPIWVLHGNGKAIVNTVTPKFSYDGQYNYGKMHGRGIFKDETGTHYSGEWDNDVLIPGTRNNIRPRQFRVLNPDSDSDAEPEIVSEGGKSSKRRKRHSKRRQRHSKRRQRHTKKKHIK